MPPSKKLAVERFSDPKTKFVRDTSAIKPLGANVIGSWSKRGVSAARVSISPAELTTVAMLGRAYVLLVKDIGLGTTKGIPLAI